MKVIARTGREDLACVYIAEFESGKMVEFCESLEPPYPKEDKWVLIISTLFGCPVKCKFCDASGYYKGKLSAAEMIDQIDYLILKSFPYRKIDVKKFKIQFARMGEPAFNPAVLDVLKTLPEKYVAPGLIPSISTIAPVGRDDFFRELKTIKDELYGSRFQMQFSLHSSDESQRDELMPVKKWSLKEIAGYGENFYNKGDRKITLNFALATNTILEPDVIRACFDPDIFFIKITPVNPTIKSKQNNIDSLIEADKYSYDIIDDIRNNGFDVLLSYGEQEENNIGSNCGQHLMNYLEGNLKSDDSYTYKPVYEKK